MAHPLLADFAVICDRTQSQFPVPAPRFLGEPGDRQFELLDGCSGLN
ncbi:hypothetical protein [Microcoleus sp. bin38.metabat.b11b12b14.051]|nr:hypothetical protein [Microcoleus sp. bin38.metabat.b11b12b14.051]